MKERTVHTWIKTNDHKSLVYFAVWGDTPLLITREQHLTAQRVHLEECLVQFYTEYPLIWHIKKSRGKKKRTRFDLIYYISSNELKCSRKRFNCSYKSLELYPRAEGAVVTCSAPRCPQQVALHSKTRWVIFVISSVIKHLHLTWNWIDSLNFVELCTSDWLCSQITGCTNNHLIMFFVFFFKYPHVNVYTDSLFPKTWGSLHINCNLKSKKNILVHQKETDCFGAQQVCVWSDPRLWKG